MCPTTGLGACPKTRTLCHLSMEMTAFGYRISALSPNLNIARTLGDILFSRTGLGYRHRLKDAEISRAAEAVRHISIGTTTRSRAKSMT